MVQNRLPHQRIFPLAVLGAGACMLAASSMSSLGLCLAFTAGMGVCAGAVYVLGFTILQENVEDELRGRIFAALYTLSRLCLLISLSLAPLLAGILDKLSDRLLDRRLELVGITVELPGVRADALDRGRHHPGGGHPGPAGPAAGRRRALGRPGDDWGPMTGLRDWAHDWAR